MEESLKKIFSGEVFTDPATLKKYSHDASLLEIMPSHVLFPRNIEDLKALVKFVKEKKREHPELSITARSAGTDMSGGPLGESLVLDFTQHFTAKKVDFQEMSARVEPGVFYRDLDLETSSQNVSLPVYPASRQIAALGGMIMNNAGGEKTLRYGQLRNFVQEISMVLSDGNEYSFRKIDKEELQRKMEQSDFEGDIYRKTFALISQNHDLITSARPKTTKNSAGYALWDVWDTKVGTFDLTQLFTGSQGTLGLMTSANIRLMKSPDHKVLFALFLKSWDDLPSLVNVILPFKPESMEVFDDTTMKLGLRFMPEIANKAGEGFLRFAARFLPEAVIGLRMLRIPKLVVLVQIVEDDMAVLTEKKARLMTAIQKLPVYFRILAPGPDAEKYWIMRRESFNLLRKHVKGKRTAPFIDDFAISPDKMPEFLPKLLRILRKSGITANIAGHAGDGNYHIIPLMDLTKESERAKVVPVAEEVYDLVIEFGGTITAEHNDGVMRTPFLKKMFGSEVCDLFKQVKFIFDPQNIFNPGKKVGGTIEYLQSHIAK